MHVHTSSCLRSLMSLRAMQRIDATAHQRRSAAQVCADYRLYPGNLYRMLQSLRNLVDELHSMASMRQDTDLLDALTDVHPLLVRDIAVGDSLYVQKH